MNNRPDLIIRSYYITGFSMFVNILPISLFQSCTITSQSDIKAILLAHNYTRSNSELSGNDKSIIYLEHKFLWMAMPVIRRHRLTERLLNEVMHVHAFLIPLIIFVMSLPICKIWSRKPAEESDYWL